MADLKIATELVNCLEEVLERLDYLHPKEFLHKGNREELALKLVVPLETLLDDFTSAVDELQSIGECFPYPRDGHVVAETLVSEAAPSKIGGDLLRDICGHARRELSEVDANLKLVTEMRREDLLSECDAVRRRIRRIALDVLGVVDFYTTNHTAFTLSRGEDTDTAVALRAAFARFRRALLPAEQVTPEIVRGALVQASRNLSCLLSKSELLDIRIRDRVTLLALQYRLREHVEQPKPIPEALRFYPDIVAVAHQLRSINDRRELRVSDESVLSALQLVDFSPKITKRVLADIMDWLPRLEGMDDRIDDIIAQMSRGEFGSEVLASLKAAVAPLHSDPITDEFDVI